MIKELTEKDIDRLDNILFEMGDNAMELEAVDGLFCALACSPRLISPSDYLPIIFDGEIDCDNESLFNETLQLLFSYWNAISSKLSKPVEGPDDIYFPYFILDTGEHDIDGRLWAIGFMIGVTIFYDDYEDLISDEKMSQFLIPMITLSGQEHEDPNIRTDPIPKEDQNKLLALMLFSVHEIYDFFKDERMKQNKKEPFDLFKTQKKEVHIGRNDPCHCGSGSKFKKCCINKKQEMLH